MTGARECQPEAAALRQHTPTPWRVHGLYTEEIYATVDEKRFMVADISGAGSQAQDEANAAFIVEAVNSHAALKSRVKELEAQAAYDKCTIDFLKGESSAEELAKALDPVAIFNIINEEVYFDRFDERYDYGDAVARIRALVVPLESRGDAT